MDGEYQQGRFRSFPLEADEHLLTVLRYGERNAARANLVTRADRRLELVKCSLLAGGGKPSELLSGRSGAAAERMAGVGQ